MTSIFQLGEVDKLSIFSVII